MMNYRAAFTLLLIVVFLCIMVVFAPLMIPVAVDAALMKYTYTSANFDKFSTTPLPDLPQIGLNLVLTFCTEEMPPSAYVFVMITDFTMSSGDLFLSTFSGDYIILGVVYVTDSTGVPA
jgi:hypothetical protein